MSLTGVATASIPVWTFAPQTATTISVPANGTASVSYLITNHSAKPHQLILSSNTPAGITNPSGTCVLQGRSRANPTPTCTLTLNINGSQLSSNVSGGPLVCEQGGARVDVLSTQSNGSIKYCAHRFTVQCWRKYFRVIRHSIFRK